MTKVDYYLILEVKRSDSHEVIKTSYRRLARRYHPDQNQGNDTAEERFKRVVEAWEVLGNPDRRRLYDMFGHRSTSRGFQDVSNMDLKPVDVFSQLVEQIRQELRTRIFRRRGKDLHIEVTLTMGEILLGSTRVFEIPRLGVDGSIERRRFEVTIPRGMTPGRILSWKGYGAPGTHGGENGNLLVTIRVEAHPIFRFQGSELVADLYIEAAEAAAGLQLDIPTPWGVRPFDIPAETKHGARLEARLLGGLDKQGNRRPLWLVIHVLPDDAPPPLKAAFLEAREKFAQYVNVLRAG